MSYIQKEFLNGNLNSIQRCYEDEFNLTGYIIQKADYEKAKHIPQLNRTHSLYFLLGQTIYQGTIKPTAYIGITTDQPAYKRLEQHSKNIEWYSDYWDRAIIFTSDAWENEDGDYRMKYLEQVFWLLMDKSVYFSCNNQEPNRSKHTDYDKQPNKYIDTITRIAKILSSENCKAFDKALKEKHDTEVKKINSNKKLSKQEKAEKLKHQAELYNWVLEVVTPDQAVGHIVNSLFDNVILPSISNLTQTEQISHLRKLRFLDIACKETCEFLECIATRLSKELAKRKAFINETVAARHVIKDQLYSLTVNAKTLELARSNLFADTDSIQAQHIQYIDDYIKKIARSDTYLDNSKKDSGHTELYREILGNKIIDNLQGIFNSLGQEENMKFDIVIGNPPYSDNIENGNGGGGNNLYLYFMKKANEITSRYSCLILPSNWMIQYPHGISHSLVDELRRQTDKMIELHDFKDTTKVFGDMVQIPGGVCYYIMDKNKETTTTDFYSHSDLYNNTKSTRVIYDKDYNIIIRDEKAIPILESITKVTGSKLGGFNKVYVGATSHFDNPTTGIMSTNWDGYSIIDTEEYNIEYYLKSGNSAHKSNLVDEISCGIPSLGRAYISIDQIPKNAQDYKRHKLIIGKAFSAGNPQIIDKPVYIGNNSVCSKSYIPIFSESDTKEECFNIAKYMMTKFFRYLVSVLKADQDLPNKVYALVPIQKFIATKIKVDIDWTKSLSEIDQQLYHKYHLDTLIVDLETNQTAAEYIENKIKSIE